MKKNAILVGATAALGLSACSAPAEEETAEAAETMVAEEAPAVDERTTDEGDNGDPVPDDRTGVDDRIGD